MMEMSLVDTCTVCRQTTTYHRTPRGTWRAEKHKTPVGRTCLGTLVVHTDGSVGTEEVLP